MSLTLSIAVASVSFEQVSYTVPVTSDNITLRIVVNETLQTTITFDVNITGIEGVRSSGLYDIPLM